LAWFLLSAFSVLLGAEVNAELERQTRKDTTVGAEKPAGERGATASDTLGESVS
jgi:membrane protein